MEELLVWMYIVWFLIKFGAVVSLIALFVWKFKPTRKLINKYIGNFEFFWSE